MDPEGSTERSGLRWISYQVNSGQEVTNDFDEFGKKIVTKATDKAVYSITGETAAQTIVFDVMDNAGNRAEIKSKFENVRIDTTDPELSALTLNPEVPAKEAADISYTVSDAGSGLKSVFWQYKAAESGTYGDSTALSVSEASGSFKAEANGWYQVEPAPASKVDQAYQKFTNQAPKLQ